MSKNKPIEITAANGVRNDLSPERFEVGDLVTGINVEIDETGKLYRRLGTSAAVMAGDMHSLWGDAAGAFAVRNGVLGRIDQSTLGFTALAPVSGRVRYQRIANSVFWTDGIYAGEITLEGNRRAGIAVPTTPQVSVTRGDLLTGRYIFTLTYARNDGTESGAAIYSVASVGNNSGLSFVLPVSDDPSVEAKHLYVSSRDGEIPYRIGTYSNAVTSALITALPDSMLAVRTAQMGPVPAGHVIGYYNGRLYVAYGNYLCYSQPYEYGLFNLMENYIGFPTPVKTFAPVSDGIFVGSDDETVFLEGTGPENFVRRPVATYGSILGTEQYVPGHLVGEEGVSGSAAMWMSTQGVCIGLSGGEFKNLTGGKYILPEGVSQGASLLKVRGGTPQLITSLM